MTDTKTTVADRLRAAGLKVKPLEFVEGRNDYWFAQSGYQIARCGGETCRVRLHGKVVCRNIKGFERAEAWANNHRKKTILAALENSHD
jgi:hypothetical protein